MTRSVSLPLTEITMTKVINLDALTDEPAVVIVLNGVEHAMVAPTVGSFVTNMKMVQSLAVDAGVADEVDMMIGMILRAFPTLTREDVEGMSFKHLQSISDLSRTGQVATMDAAVAAEAEKTKNPTRAKRN